MSSVPKFEPALREKLAASALSPDGIARCAAREIPPGSVVNVGIGMPGRVANFVPPAAGIMFMAENGILGVGPRPAPGEEDKDFINASREPITAVPGAAIFGHADAFAMIRGGHVDLAILGGLQVSARGDLANWTVPGAGRGGIGGAMDLAVGCKAIYVMMTHLTKEGAPKLLEECTYPLTARRVVRKLFTDIAFIEFTGEGPLLRAVAEGLAPEDVQAATGPRLRAAGELGVLREDGPS